MPSDSRGLDLALLRAACCDQRVKATLGGCLSVRDFRAPDQAIPLISPLITNQIRVGFCATNCCDNFARYSRRQGLEPFPRQQLWPTERRLSSPTTSAQNQKKPLPESWEGHITDSSCTQNVHCCTATRPIQAQSKAAGLSLYSLILNGLKAVGIQCRGANREGTVVQSP